MAEKETASDVSKTRKTRTVRSNSLGKETDTKLPWTEQEKKALLGALRKYGWKNYNKLEEAVGTKNKTDIIRYLYLKHHQSRRISSVYVARQKTPIELWLDKVNKLVGSKPDYSQCLGKVMHLIGKWEPHPKSNSENEPDYSKIYEYLGLLLKGEPPPDLSSVDSSVVLHMIEMLASILKTIPSDEEMQVIKKIGENDLKVHNGCANTAEVDESQTEKQKHSDNSLGTNEINKMDLEDSKKQSCPSDNKRTISGNSKHVNTNDSFNPFNIPIKVLGGTCQKFKSHPLFCTK